ncbi:MAG: hypothetical protein H7067_07575 [Burkholderiales bacterium]|nr:hypothetical protein [Opitutaceae bacterium]
MKTIAQVPAAETLDALAKNYAARRARVATLVARMDDEIRAIHRRHRADLTEALGTAEGALSALHVEIEAHPELFERPRTWTLHGIKLGFKKGSGRVEFEDSDRVIERLKKRFGDLSPQVEACVEVVEKLNLDALRDLDGKDLAALGVSIEGSGDVVYIKSADTAVDKLVKQLLKEGERATEEG